MSDLYHLELFKLPDELDFQELFAKILMRISENFLKRRDQLNDLEGYFCSVIPWAPAVVAVVAAAVEIAAAWHIFGTWGYVAAVAVALPAFVFISRSKS